MKTLAEAAAEVLNKSRTTAPAEPIKRMPAEINDLGGSTHTDPAGGEVGKKAAAALTKTATPGKPAPVGAEASKGKLKEEDEQEDLDIVAEEDVETIEVDDDDIEDLDDVEIEEELSEEDYAEIEEQKIEMIKNKIKEIGFSEDMDALFGSETLSEDFRTKARSIFEAAVISRSVQVVEELEKDILQAADESVSEIQEELEARIDSYLNYVTEQWINENAVAIESGLKAEIFEGFMAGLHNLFVENYIEIPDDKIDVLENMTAEISELKEKLDDALHENIELSKVISESVKNEILSTVCEDLTATQTEKMKSLAEGVEFTTEGEYAEKLAIIKESYFSNKVNTPSSFTTTLDESDDTIEQHVDGVMKHYIQAISRTIK